MLSSKKVILKGQNPKTLSTIPDRHAAKKVDFQKHNREIFFILLCWEMYSSTECPLEAGYTWVGNFLKL
jgi:hypothetical protein